MTPTPRLRFVERVHPHMAHQTIRVLQQWFAYDIQYPMTRGEWKDVPLEKEND